MVTNFTSTEERSPGLHASVSGDGRDVLLLHGLFGMGSNLGSLARALAPHYRVHQLDLPNHGRSPWQSHMTLASLAQAVGAYADSLGAEAPVLIGHSLGGKVAMQRALTAPERVAATVVADILPIEYPASHDQVFAAIAAVVAAQPDSRREAGEIMARHVAEPGVAQFLLLSLRRDDDGTYRWRFNAEALRDSYTHLREPPAAGSPPFAGPALFIYGEQSAYVTEEGMAVARTRFPAARFTAIAGAGHWLHVEKPEEFNAAVMDFLATLPTGARAAP